MQMFGLGGNDALIGGKGNGLIFANGGSAKAWVATTHTARGADAIASARITSSCAFAWLQMAQMVSLCEEGQRQ